MFLQRMYWLILILNALTTLSQDSGKICKTLILILVYFFRLLIKTTICEGSPQMLTSGIHCLQDYKEIQFLNGSKVVDVLIFPSGCKSYVESYDL